MGTERNEAEKNGGHPPNSATLSFGLETIFSAGASAQIRIDFRKFYRNLP